MAEQATVAIPQDVIRPIVEARIQAAIVESLGKTPQLIEAAVTAALNYKVNSDGKRSTYDNDNKFTVLESMTYRYLQAAASEALKEYLEGAKEQVKKRVIAELQKKQTSVAAALVDGLAKAIDTAYGHSITIHLKERSS
jgi:hypothetical protein